MKAMSFLVVSQKIGLAYSKLCLPLLEEFGLSQVSFDILMFLANNPEHKTAQEICELRHIKKNLVSVHVEKLVSLGYLERFAVEGDRRKIGLSCTKKAEVIVSKGKEMQKLFFEGMTKGISDEEWKVFKRFFETLGSNAEKMV